MNFPGTPGKPSPISSEGTLRGSGFPKVSFNLKGFIVGLFQILFLGVFSNFATFRFYPLSSISC